MHSIFASRRSPGSLFSALVLATFVAIGSSSTASATCPDNSIWGYCFDAADISNAPTRDYGGGTWQVGTPCPSGACYDLPHGAFLARGVGSYYSEGCVSVVLAEDIYEIAGLPPGGPLSFYAELHVHGSIVAPGGLQAGLAENSPSGASQLEVVGTPGNADFVVLLPLVHAPEETFRLQIRLSANGNFPAGAANATAELRFSGLPAYAWIQSCQAYDLPVPAQPATWGALKVMYRE